MLDIPIVYSVYKRHKILQNNLNLFLNLGITNVYFLLDSSHVTDLDNLKCIKHVKDFCKKTKAKLYFKNNNFGFYCMLVNFYKDVCSEWLKEYHLLIEDDFILTDKFFEFHSIFQKNSLYKKYKAIVPFGFNVGDKDLKIFEIEPIIKGCLWGAGHNSFELQNFFIKDFYRDFKENYLDLSYIKFLCSNNNKLLFTSHNLFSYKGFDDSRDRDRLIACNNFPEFFNYSLNFNYNGLEIENKLAKKYLERHDFYVNDCKECI